MPEIEIRYWRPPNRLQVFRQQLVVDRPDYKVTFVEHSTASGTLKVGERVILEPAAPIVWFVFPGAWYDLGRFHLRDGTFTGYYGNVIAPAKLDGATWEIYDLCLDIWVEPDGTLQVLDQDEFDEAVDRLWIDKATADRARRELERLVREARQGRWPPSIVQELDLQRVRALRLEDD